MAKLQMASKFAKHQNTRIWLFCLIGSFSVGNIIPLHGNQFVYFTPLYKDIFPNLNNDWYANTSDSNIVFTLTTKLLYHGLSFSNIHFFNQWNLVLVLLLNTANIYFIFRLIRILDSKKVLKDFEILTLIVVCLVFTYPDIKSGVAGLYFIQPLLQPSSFGTFFLAGLYFTFQALDSKNFRIKKLIIANFLYILSVVFHPSLLASFLIVSLAIVTTNLIKNRRQNQKVSLQVVFSISAIVVVSLLNPESLKFINPNLELRTSLQYFAEVRIPYHVIPNVWFTHEELIRLIVILLSAMIVQISFGKLQRVSIFYSLISLAIPISSILAELTNNTSLSLAMPWRISIFLYPVAQLVLLSTAINFTLSQEKFTNFLIFLALFTLVLNALQMTIVAAIFVLMVFVCKSAKRWKNRNLRIILSLLLIISGSIYGFEQTSSAYAREKIPVQEDFLKNSELRGVGLVPVEADNLRLGYGLSIYVNSQAAPNASSSIIEWHHRILNAKSIYEKPSRICDSEVRRQVNWIIFPRNQQLPACLRDRKILEGETWKAVIIDDEYFE
jgi:hypothetical protein